ncbi:MAG TPA: PQQ-dependent sugar dehydrogenase [Variovorax sp.]|nr:PQQ-dependent sugar dehydrogenase [Variovorax sp.]
MANTGSLLLVLALAAGITACGGGGGGGPTPAASGAPNSIAGTTTVGDAAQDGRVERPPPGTVNLKLVELVTGLNGPWSLAFLPDSRILITQRGGQLRLRNADASPAAANDLVSGVPQVLFEGQGGLLDVAVDPQFASNRRIYLAFSEGTSSSNSTAVARAELNVTTRALENVTVIFRQLPKVASSAHFGSRLMFDRAGHLFVTLGDRLLDSQRGFAQDVTRGNGKVVRITTEGAAAPGNPGFGANAHLGLWSIGHRNPQGAALHPASGELWISEHGPQGGDEINRVVPGLNYGWPVISYGQEYGTTTQVGEGTAKAGMEQPVSYWETIDGTPWTGGAKSSIAPSGIAFYSADVIPQWKGNLFVGALAGTALWRLTLNGNAVTGRERLLAERGERIRDVRQGPDGWLYLLTDNGKLLRYEQG